jgi:hypothetical protein
MTAERRPPDANNTRQDGVKDFKPDSKYVRKMVSAKWVTNLVSLRLRHFAVAQLRNYAHAFVRVEQRGEASCPIYRHKAHRSVLTSQGVQSSDIRWRGSE